MTDSRQFGPLANLRILDIATIIAAPFAGTLLADLGADVVKLELPGIGDGMRGFPPFKEGKSLWWKAANRGKQFGTLDLRKKEGADLLLKMLPQFDVLIENFRPGTLDRWGLDKETLWKANPKLVILRVTAFGQDGPYIDRPGFARIFEAMGGLTHITGDPDRPPVHTGYPISDAFGGVFGAMSILAALYKVANSERTEGEEIDLALTEATFRLLDFLAIEYDQLGDVRERSGNKNQYSAPSDVYLTSDKKYVSLAGSTNTTFLANATAVGRPELAKDPRFENNALRVKNGQELDRIFGEFISTHTLDEVLDAFNTAGGTIAPIYSIEQIFNDPQYQAREAITTVPDDDFGSVRLQNVVPKMTRNPGKVRWTSKELGQDSDAVFEKYLGLSKEEIEDCRSRGII
ncbi:MAG: CoA transferase [Sneathiella sp.]|jgi:crotonobetainyl-CoA:carnitine CoA-transferase CaiB-like acyl-CoA transferase|uniref:CaiB/BaiF CoA transferase family protein n=1 Tax=Sneathiella sp. TaxID=1964365 RepID=UPI000C4A95F5|nr:CoA transferase [Sneathiella sp.]MAL77968.1 CoA transferase [Sneathiella sp.]